jgi:tetratricopeptide (TPR) repeat protein
MKLLHTGLIIGLMFVTTTVSAMDGDVVKAEQFWKNRHDKSMVEMAIATLESTVGKDATNYEALWRLGRYYQFLGDCSNDKKMKLPYYQKGLIYAERAVKINSQGPDGHLQYAILLGCVSLEKSVLNGFVKLPTIRDEINTTLRLDPLNARAHNTLALFYWKVPGKPISFGDRKKAQEEAALAVKYDPKVIYYWLILGQIADTNKDYQTARIALRKVLELPCDPEDPSDVYYKDWACKELAKLPMV